MKALNRKHINWHVSVFLLLAVLLFSVGSHSAQIDQALPSSDGYSDYCNDAIDNDIDEDIQLDIIDNIEQVYIPAPISYKYAYRGNNKTLFVKPWLNIRAPPQPSDNY